MIVQYPAHVEPFSVAVPPADSWLGVWPVRPSQPASRRRAIDPSGIISPVLASADDVTLDKWYKPWAEPITKRKIKEACWTIDPMAFLQGTSTETLTMDKWFQALSLRTRTPYWRNNALRGVWMIDPMAFLQGTNVYTRLTGAVLPDRLTAAVLASRLAAEVID